MPRNLCSCLFWPICISCEYIWVKVIYKARGYKSAIRTIVNKNVKPQFPTKFWKSAGALLFIHSRQKTARPDIIIRIHIRAFLFPQFITFLQPSCNIYKKKICNWTAPTAVAYPWLSMWHIRVNILQQLPKHFLIIALSNII